MLGMEEMLSASSRGGIKLSKRNRQTIAVKRTVGEEGKRRVQDQERMEEGGRKAWMR